MSDFDLSGGEQVIGPHDFDALIEECKHFLPEEASPREAERLAFKFAMSDWLDNREFQVASEAADYALKHGRNPFK